MGLVFYAFGGGGSGGVMRLRGVWKGVAGSWSSPEKALSVERVRTSWIESPHEVIAWQQTTVENLQGFSRSPSCGCVGIAECALVVAEGAPRIAPLAFSQPLLLRPSVSDKAQMPDRIEIERRNRIN
jgi:hypothetical protein